ncbi:phospholipase D family protein [Shewanella aestuarii]|uniref:Phospholipase D family protein n=1 Tax=Shewanella aestuarii TaxID=1028752 RepID=A0A6G9QKF7_9GAMM|nr:phospholipase D family protein [Shewanella aestuarii]QIR15054.1 phospholipase D family protein [Shewanella aestuarii]
MFVNRMLKASFSVYGSILLLLVLVSGCSSHHVYPTAPLEYQLSKPDDTLLAQYLQQLPELETHNGIYPLYDGLDAFTSRLLMIGSASVSIDLQYYLYHDDETGKLLTLYLYNAAERGVRVRLLVDDMTTKGRDLSILNLAAHPNISIRIFNPANERTFRNLAFLNNFSRLNHRMHNKSLTIDNLVSVVGGRNIGDEYYSASHSVEFGDFDVVMIGEVVSKVSEQFDLYWNSSQVRPIEQLFSSNTDILTASEIQQYFSDYHQSMLEHPYLIRLTQSEFLHQMLNDQLVWYWSDAELIYDLPNKLNQLDEPTLLDDLNLLFKKTNDEMVILSPYFVPTDKGTEALISAVKQGKKVTIITNSLAATDVLAVHAGYINYRERLVKAGVTIYEMKAFLHKDKAKTKKSMLTGSSRSSLHAKMVAIDKQHLFVGSFNFDPRSAWLNTEMGVIIDNSELTQSIVEGIDNSIAKWAYLLKYKDEQLQWWDIQQNIYYQQEPEANWWQRFSAKFLSFLPIESQL